MAAEEAAAEQGICVKAGGTCCRKGLIVMCCGDHPFRQAACHGRVQAKLYPWCPGQHYVHDTEAWPEECAACWVASCLPADCAHVNHMLFSGLGGSFPGVGVGGGGCAASAFSRLVRMLLCGFKQCFSRLKQRHAWVPRQSSWFVVTCCLPLLL